MRYRLVTTRADGEQRSIDYATRSAAFGHFSSTAHSRNIIGASLFKNDNDPEDFAPEAWRNIARMSIIRDAMPPEVAMEIPR